MFEFIIIILFMLFILLNISEFLHYVGCYKCSSSRHIEKNNGFKIEHKSYLLRLETLNIDSLHDIDILTCFCFFFRAPIRFKEIWEHRIYYTSKLNPEKRFYECRQPAAWAVLVRNLFSARSFSRWLSFSDDIFRGRLFFNSKVKQMMA